MTNIIIIRHGETDWNKEGRLQGIENIPLNSTGKAQASMAGNFLREEKLGAIITSPLDRAQETATIIGQCLDEDEKIRVKKSFIERNHGDISGLTIEEQKVKFPNDDYEVKESWEVLCTRVKKGLEDVAESYPGENVVLVTHGLIIKSILEITSEGGLNSENLSLLNACISNCSYNDSKWEINYYNKVSHLNRTLQ
ncbi:histidine phosphatase family protein [Halobacillus amylolyticus]|uniref:Histidine phosphatase family protein n=1 Tax=Halobacillus amylolyticus TaxID=2932259 RepID=A0ABY4HFL9_9BACI|nr:histidine phosphatase family protein [Halobacillus amylolyticus]UOR13674.1 histidine phosphatase family protein [Halobacillus amylolyticus]